MVTLKNARFIHSKRGVGGYFLSKSPEEISLGDVIRVIDGLLTPLQCVNTEHLNCSKEMTCGIRSVMLDVANATAEILDHVSLADVCNRIRGVKERRGEYLMYYI